MLTSERNLFIEAVAIDTSDLAAITEALNDRGLTIHDSEIISNSYSQPFSYFEYSRSPED